MGKIISLEDKPVIIQLDGHYYVQWKNQLSGGPYPNKDSAKRRLAQIQAFIKSQEK